MSNDIIVKNIYKNKNKFFHGIRFSTNILEAIFIIQQIYNRNKIMCSVKAHFTLKKSRAMRAVLGTKNQR